MELYIRFVVTLALGLLGVVMVLKVMLDGVFNEWDAVADLGYFFRHGFQNRWVASERVEDVMLELEKSKTPTLTTSIYEKKRQQLEELSAIESRLSRSGKPIVLTPLPPPPPRDTIPV